VWRSCKAAVRVVGCWLIVTMFQRGWRLTGGGGERVTRWCRVKRVSSSSSSSRRVLAVVEVEEERVRRKEMRCCLNKVRPTKEELFSSCGSCEMSVQYEKTEVSALVSLAPRKRNSW
jgi:hypothetical protein